MPLLESVIAGLITRAIGDFSVRLLSAAHKVKGKSARKDIELASQLASKNIVDAVDVNDVTLALSTTISLANIAKAIDSLEVKSLVHELLAVRLVNDPDYSVDAIVLSFRSCLRAKIPTADRGEVDRVALVLFQYIDGRCSEVVQIVSKSKKEVLDRIKLNANYSLIRNTLGAIERHCEALVSKGDLQDQELEKFVAKYRKQVLVKHGSIVLPDFERKRRFPVEDLYVDASLTGHMKRATLSGIQDAIDRTVILGDPGGGKSTAAAVLAHRLAKSNDGLVPFLIILRDFPIGEADGPSVLEFIENRLNSFYQVKSPPGAVEMLLLSGRALVIFDGLDELIDTSRRRDITDIVEMFCELYPLARVLVTSREVGYQEAPVEESTFEVLRITRFSDAQVGEYVKNWFKRASSDEVYDPGDLARSFMEESSVVSDLRGNPLLLSLMCIMYRGEKYIPRNRPELYEKCATMLFDKWDSSRKIYVDVEVAHLVDVALKHLAWWIFTRDDSGEGVREDDLVKETTRFLLESAFESEVHAKRAAQQFISFCKGRAWVFSDAGSTAEGEALYKFTHRTFLEYFTAYEFSRRSKSSERLARQMLPRISKGEWDVVAQLAMQIENRNRTNGANRIMEVLLNDKVKRAEEGRANVLDFICRCLDFHTPAPQMVRDIAARAVALACTPGRSSFPITRRPLYSLLTTSSQRSWEIIEDQLTREFSARVKSEDSEIRRSTWFMLLGLTEESNEIRSIVNARGSDEPQILKWHREFIVANHDLLDRECFEDSSLRCMSVYDGHESVDKIADVRGSSNGSIDKYHALFRMAPNPFYGWQRVPGAYWIPRLALKLTGRESEKLRSILRTVATWIETLPPPPWLNFEEIEDHHFYFDVDVDFHAMDPLSVDEFVATALLMLPLFERRIPFDEQVLSLEMDRNANRGVRKMRQEMLDDRIVRLVRARQFGDLDVQVLHGVEGVAAELLEAWARKEVDFVAAEDRS